MAARSVDLLAAGPIVVDMVAAILREKDRLSEIDGATGDGDHGVNMAKGFRLAGAKLDALGHYDLAQGFDTLGDTLLGDIGGSMGPLYGTFFTDMAEALKGAGTLDAARCAAMLHAGLDAVRGLGDAKVGDKTLVDVLAPATAAFDETLGRGEDFAASLRAMTDAAAEGLESTRTMVARLGRAARLGERSRGFLDAGAASCALLLTTLAEGLLTRLAADGGAGVRPVSISAAPYDGYAFPEVLDSMARCGLRWIEPAFIVGYTEPFDETTFADASARRYRGWLDASGLACHAFSSHIDLGRADAVPVFKGRMDFAAALGAKVINTNAAVRTSRDRFLDNIGPLADHAAALGMVIGLENPGNGEDNLMNDAAEGLALIRDLGLPAVRLNYDPGNTASHRPGRIDAAADAVAALPGCGHFHLKDVRRDAEGWSFTVPGRGEIDCDTIMEALAASPDLPFAVELPLRMRRRPDAQPVRRPEPVPLAEIEAALRDCLAYVRRWVPEA